MKEICDAVDTSFSEALEWLSLSRPLSLSLSLSLSLPPSPLPAKKFVAQVL